MKGINTLRLATLGALAVAIDDPFPKRIPRTPRERDKRSREESGKRLKAAEDKRLRKARAKCQLVSFEEAMASGRLFRHYSMARFEVPVWFRPQREGFIHVLGPDDIMPVDEAVPPEMRTGYVFELGDKI
jgi:hypothetical protein